MSYIVIPNLFRDLPACLGKPLAFARDPDIRQDDIYQPRNDKLNLDSKNPVNIKNAPAPMAIKVFSKAPVTGGVVGVVGVVVVPIV